MRSWAGYPCQSAAGANYALRPPLCGKRAQDDGVKPKAKKHNDGREFARKYPNAAAWKFKTDEYTPPTNQNDWIASGRTLNVN
jgi:hypothetical protein